MNWATILFFGTLLLVVAILWRLTIRGAVGARSFIWLLGVFGLGAVLLPAGLLPSEQTIEESPLVKLTPGPRRDSGFVSSATCRSCHPGEYHSWHRTFHRTMTQRATPAAVVGDFNNVQLTLRGRDYHLMRNGNRFQVKMVDPAWEVRQIALRRQTEVAKDPPIAVKDVVMTTGSHHYQAYWVSTSRAKELWQLPWVYLIAEKRWIPAEEAFLQPPGQDRRVAIWNYSCIQCHTAGANPLLSPIDGKYYSRVAELGIACESCHGPGEEHIRKHRNPVARYRLHFSEDGDSTIVNPKRLSHRLSSQVCGQCHSTFADLTEQTRWYRKGVSFRAGDELSKSFELYQYDKRHPDKNPGYQQRYWRDGANRVGGREYSAMIESSCYLNGKMSCLSCHSMHSGDPDDQLAPKTAGDHACLQCHTTMKGRIKEHTHHPESSSGSRCYNCHMPHTSYALFKAIRSHTVDSPSITKSVKTGRPNACNLCHVDQPLDWSAGHLKRWYGIETVSLSPDDKGIAASLLWLFKGDAAQRAIAAWHLGWKESQAVAGDDWQVGYLARMLEDPYAAIRFLAFKQLRRLPGFEKFQIEYPGTQATHARERQRAEEIWRSRLRNLRASPRLLTGKSGRIDETTVKRLMKQRDNRPIEIRE